MTFIIQSHQPTGAELAHPIYDAGSPAWNPRAIPPRVPQYGVCGRDGYLWWTRDANLATKFNNLDEAERVMRKCRYDFWPQSDYWSLEVIVTQ